MNNDVDGGRTISVPLKEPEGLAVRPYLPTTCGPMYGQFHTAENRWVWALPPAAAAPALLLPADEVEALVLLVVVVAASASGCAPSSSRMCASRRARRAGGAVAGCCICTLAPAGRTHAGGEELRGRDIAEKK